MQKVARRIGEFSGKILCTVDTHYEDYLQTQEGKHLSVVRCQKGKPGWKMPQEIQDALDLQGAKGCEKPSFGSPEPALDPMKENREEKMDKIVLLGICTDICVLTNAISLKCFLPEAPIVVMLPAVPGSPKIATIRPWRP